jgi:hypothetical protein
MLAMTRGSSAAAMYQSSQDSWVAVWNTTHVMSTEGGGLVYAEP